MMSMDEIRAYVTPKLEKLKRGKAYPLASPMSVLPHKLSRQGVMAVWTGEKRAPKKGEWFLSGGVIEAYQAPNDLNQVSHIAKLVRVKTVTETRIIEDFSL